jgi:signal transduction histidine kinase/ligand-binding sensor domain-containing protein
MDSVWAQEDRAVFPLMIPFRYCQSWRSWPISLLIVCACVPLLAIDRDRRIDQLYHTKWTFEDGAPSEIFAMTQSADGYLWMGSTSGLFRFDGIHFKKYEPESGPALPSTNVSSLLAPPDGGLWVGFGAGGVSFIKDGKAQNYGAQDGLPTNTVRALVRDRQGFIWAAALGGLARLEGSRWKVVTAEWNFSGAATAALVDQKGTVWIGTDKTIFSLPEGQKKFTRVAEYVGYVTRLTQAPNGTVWISLLGHSALLLPMLPKRLKIAQPNLRMSSLAVFADDQGSVWLTTMGSGLRRLPYPERQRDTASNSDAETTEVYSQKDGLSSDYIESIFEDREGNLWIGTNAGLDRFRQGSVVPVAVPAGSAYFSLIQGDEDAIWAAPMDSRVVEIKHGRVEAALTQTPSLVPAMGSTAIYRNSKGLVWVCTVNGLTRINDGRTETIHYPSLTNGNEDRIGAGIAMTEDVHGNLWVSIMGKGVYRLENGQWSSLESLGGPPGYAISAFTDSTGRIWFAYADKRVVLLDGDKVRIFSGKQGALADRVRSIQGRGSKVWFAGDEGVDFFDGSRFRPLIPAEGSGFRGVFGIVETSENGLWFSEDRGIIYIPESEIRLFEKDPERRIGFQLFDRLDGLPARLQKSSRSPSVIQESNGVLWFATTQGIAWIDPKHISRNALIPPVSIESFTADGKVFAPSMPLLLPARTQSLRITYTALSLSIPERVRFKYRLEGLDRDWQNVGSRREAIYTNLGPGSYRFRVIACNNDGVWNNSGAVLSLVVAPAFYQTIWFRILYVIAGAGVLWLLYLARMNQVTTQIQMRLGARLEERERIARELHDTLLQGFQGLVLRFQGVLKILPAQEPAHQMMAKVLDRADEVLLDGRQRVRSLREEGMAGDELPGLLVHCSEELGEEDQSRFSLAVVGTPRALEPTVCRETYRIGREAIANAFLHSHARKIESELTYGQASLRLIVRDDGRGLEQSILDKGRAGHWGLAGMRERASKIGARLNIWSEIGAGTEIDLSVPAGIAYPRNQKLSLWRGFKRALIGMTERSEP